MTSPTPSAESQRLLAERYGRRPGSRRWSLVAAVCLLAGVGLGWLVWAAWSSSDAEVEAEVVTWEVRSAHLVDVELVVNTAGADEATCTVAAQAADATVVGEAEVAVTASTTGDQRVEVTIATEREATAVKLSGCE